MYPRFLVTRHWEPWLAIAPAPVHQITPASQFLSPHFAEPNKSLRLLLVTVCCINHKAQSRPCFDSEHNPLPEELRDEDSSSVKDFSSWADAIPPAQGLYNPDLDCGVGFIANKVVADACGILCNMTHRGAVGADARDGDVAGVMCSIPHELFAEDGKSAFGNKNMTYKGLLSPDQVYRYFTDLTDPRFKAYFALVHSRFSTNTFPSWDRAQPLGWLAHNGEINTLRGNKNWMRARQSLLSSPSFGSLLDTVTPRVEEGGSDSAAFDNVVELLMTNGALSLPEVVMMMWVACLMERWDGPALFTFSDGRYVGACLDRNGLQPCRVYITEGDTIICASEVGTITVKPETVSKGQLQLGKMLLVDTQEGRIVGDKELKMSVASSRPFGEWLERQLVTIAKLKECVKEEGLAIEQLNMLITPMVYDGQEARLHGHRHPSRLHLALAPRDLREIVMSHACYVGPEGNLLEIAESQTHRLYLPTPIFAADDGHAIHRLHKYRPGWTVAVVDTTFDKSEGLCWRYACLGV
ncbi:nucleophile aminohydrolase [Cladochytrium replicatum]|nr:nucleophile aminohydrolase [Cladochytrium replicatum]